MYIFFYYIHLQIQLICSGLWCTVSKLYFQVTFFLLSPQFLSPILKNKLQIQLQMLISQQIFQNRFSKKHMGRSCSYQQCSIWKTTLWRDEASIIGIKVMTLEYTVTLFLHRFRTINPQIYSMLWIIMCGDPLPLNDS